MYVGDMLEHAGLVLGAVLAVGTLEPRRDAALDLQMPLQRALHRVATTAARTPVTLLVLPSLRYC